MKRFVLTLLFLLLPVIPANANGELLIASSTHRDINGIFINDQLAALIAPDGQLGRAVFNKARNAPSISIDIALIEEVQDLADGYQFKNESGAVIDAPPLLAASNWLETLRRSVATKKVAALPYGNPDREFLERRAPGEYRFYKELAAVRLSGFLGATVDESESVGRSAAGLAARELHNGYRAELRRIYNLVAAPEVAALRLQLGKILNPAIPAPDLEALLEPLRAALIENSQKLRVLGGNYTITTPQYDLPVTVINDFSIPVTVTLSGRATNSRVMITELAPITVAANSQLQVELPLDILASGATDLEITLRDKSGRVVGKSATFPLRLAVISPLTTWFTTGMAIILLLTAAIQSVRRVKKRKRV